ncbi:primosomal protein N' [Flocculibacter collagenilyticus]|uniref:primosomal protein N' n=1 Tax=Flocculibacter collagenilyticus TaxID=2744479 RepID=UPI0018F63C4E|nr:primosomal protein N' [Flocculibacter collagenilyticus]
MKIAKVALPLPLRRLFDYQIPDNITNAKIGQRVVVPYGNQQRVGVIWQLTNESSFEPAKLKYIAECVEDCSTFNTQQMQLLNWAAQYFQHPIGEVVFTALPNALKKHKQIQAYISAQYRITALGANTTEDELKRAKKQWQALQHFQQHITFTKAQIKNHNELSTAQIKSLLEKGFIQEEIDLSGLNNHSNTECASSDSNNSVTPKHELLKGNELTLNTEQAIAVTAISQHTQFYPALIDGITGSGKTEVYLQSITPILAQGKQILILLPEIGLTPQTVTRFAQRFEVDVNVWHSGLNDTQRMATWLQAKRPTPSIFIGTRSAIFLPFSQLGMVIVDEEHDASLKQQEGFRYHGRDMAVMLGKMCNVPTLLGSATPSFESLNNALAERYHYFKLPNRAGKSVPPSYHTIDLKGLHLRQGLSEPLITAIKSSLKKHQQVLLFLNRRGFAPAIICHECGWLTECHRCNAFYTFHKASNRMICHHCTAQRPIPHQCEACGSSNLVPVGQGTEQIEEVLTELFPDTPITRIDRDSTRNKGSLDAAFNDIHQAGKRIIVGTQMLAKGHHFPDVTLVAILDIDSALYCADFRAPEKLAQLITQVAGRAGRGEHPGKVLLQTHYPGHPLLQDLINNGYHHFAKLGLDERQQTQLPPFSHLALIRVNAMAIPAINHFFAEVMPHLQQLTDILILGPIPSPVEKRAGKFRYQILLQANERRTLAMQLAVLLPVIESLPSARKVRWHLDIDPIDLM